jgi:hypothetical protein
VLQHVDGSILLTCACRSRTAFALITFHVKKSASKISNFMLEFCIKISHFTATATGFSFHTLAIETKTIPNNCTTTHLLIQRVDGVQPQGQHHLQGRESSQGRIDTMTIAIDNAC